MTWTTRPRSDFAGGLSGFQSGAGPEILLIHGVGLRAEAWGAMIAPLARQFTVTALDMPGHGGSAGLASPSLADYTARFAEFLASRPGPVIVAGHSMGAMLAGELAFACPERVAAPVLLNGIFQRTPEARAAVQRRAAELAEATAHADPAATLERWFGADLQAPAAKACRDWLTTCDLRGYAHAYRCFAAGDGPDPEALRALKSPALFMTGAEEPNSTPQMSRDMAGLAPKGRAAVIEGAAHMAPMTHAEEMAAAIVSFCREEHLI